MVIFRNDSLTVLELELLFIASTSMFIIGNTASHYLLCFLVSIGL